jgi:nucleoside-diphosphate-sugar epimerase
MKVFLTGATGAVGPATVRELLARGHEVRAVARSDEKAAALTALGAEPARVDLFDGEALTAAVDGCAAVVHLATNVPPLRQMTKAAAWMTHNELRTTASARLIDAALATGVDTFVKESVTFIYPDRGAEWIDESVVVDDSVAMLHATVVGERLIDRFVAGGGRGVVLRFGSFYGSEARYTDEALKLARWRSALLAGAPDGYVSSIHTHDVASAAVAALDAPSGTYNAVDDLPLTRREYLDAFSAAFGLHKLHMPPRWLVRLIGGSSSAAVAKSQRVRNRKLRDATGWAPRYASAREGWAAVAAERKGEVTV